MQSCSIINLLQSRYNQTCVSCPILQVMLRRTATLTMALAPATTTALSTRPWYQDAATTPTYQSCRLHQQLTSPCQLQAESTTPFLIFRGVRGTQLKWQLKSELTSTPIGHRPQSHWVRVLIMNNSVLYGRAQQNRHRLLLHPSREDTA